MSSRLRSTGLLLLGCATPLVGCRAPEPAAQELVRAEPLAWMVGGWSGVRRSADDGFEAPMTVRVEALPGGRDQVECLEVQGERGPYIGFAVRVYDDAARRWTMRYANGAGRRFAQLEGQLHGARTTWRSVTPGRSRLSRLESERRAPDGWTKRQFVSSDGGATWQLLFTDELVRDGDG